MTHKHSWIPAIVMLALWLSTACANEQGEGVASVNGQPQVSADPSRPADNPDERARQFVACMRGEGIDVPDPEPGDTTGKSALRFEAVDVDKAKLSAALEKCGRYLPNGGQPQRLTPEQLEQARRFAQCMRENGVPNWPDPNPEGKHAGGGPGDDIDKDDPAVRAAIEKCRGAR